MVEVWEKLAEERIKQAAKEGAFDDLPGKGRPLKLENDSHIAPEYRLAHKVLKNAGFVAPEVDIIKQINHTHDLLKDAPDEKARYRAMERLNYLQMKLESLRPGSPRLEEMRYAARLVDKFVKE